MKLPARFQGSPLTNFFLQHSLFLKSFCLFNQSFLRRFDKTKHTNICIIQDNSDSALQHKRNACHGRKTPTTELNIFHPKNHRRNIKRLPQFLRSIQISSSMIYVLNTRLLLDKNTEFESRFSHKPKFERKQ